MGEMTINNIGLGETHETTKLIYERKRNTYSKPSL